MKNLLHIIIACISLLPILTITCGCGSKKINDTADSLFTASYISSLSIEQPARALALIDTTELKRLMTDFETNRLRAVVYHNGFSDNNKSLEYALKVYASPVARHNTGSYLRLLGMLANQWQSFRQTTIISFK